MTRGDAGFSLLETLLGLTLTAMLGALMMGSLQMGTRVWERQQNAVQPGAEQLIMSQTNEWLAQAMPIKLRSVDERSFAPFAGDARRTSFLYAAPGMGNSPGVYAVDLELVATEGCNDGLSLVMRAARIVPFDGENDAPIIPLERRQLAACIASPSFVFWGAQLGESVPVWHAQWIQQPGLPSVVRLRSVDPSGAERVILTQRLLQAGSDL